MAPVNEKVLPNQFKIHIFATVKNLPERWIFVDFLMTVFTIFDKLMTN